MTDILSRRAVLSGAVSLAGASVVPSTSSAQADTAAGWDRPGLSKLQELAAGYKLASLVVLHQGQTVVSYGQPDKPCVLHSMRKAFMSGLYAQALDSGIIRLDETLADHGIDDHPNLTATERSATVGDLLTARSGVYLPLAGEFPKEVWGTKTRARPARGSHKPGTFWQYNNWDFNVLGSIYERVTQKSVFLGLDHYIAKPLGFQDFDVFRDTFSEYKNDMNGGNLTYPAYKMQLSARDIARYAQLYLQNGSWGGTQIIPPKWIKTMTQAVSFVESDTALNGYGYLWWVTVKAPNGFHGGAPVGSFHGWGGGGNYFTVMPSLDTVVVALVDSDPTSDSLAGKAPKFRPLLGTEYDGILSTVSAAHPATKI